MKTVVRTKPRMTFTAMCRFLGATPVAQTSILRQQKFPRLAHVKNYDKAVVQVQQFAVRGTPLSPQAVGLEPHESEVLATLLADGWTLPAISAVVPPLGKQSIVLQGVTISMQPDLVLLGQRRGKHRTGALKFFFPKSYDLDSEVASWMASLLFYHRSIVLPDPLASPELCIIHDVRRGISHSSTGRYTTLLKQVSEACRFISARWPELRQTS